MIGDKIPECTYLAGLDPIWFVSKNDLVFMNSMKMKFAVTVGIIHMVFGLILKGLNSIYFTDTITLIFEFVP